MNKLYRSRIKQCVPKLLIQVNMIHNTSLAIYILLEVGVIKGHQGTLLPDYFKVCGVEIVKITLKCEILMI